MSSLEFLLCAVLALTSAFMSASEIALFSLSRFQLRSLKDRSAGAFRKVKRLLADPGGLLISILVVNEIVNVALSAIITQSIVRGRAANPNDESHWVVNTLLGILATAPVVLFVCEITPKVIAAKANIIIAPLTAGPLTIVYRLMRPIRAVLRVIVSVISRATGKPEVPAATDVLKESDFLLMAEEGHKEGAIQESELGLIKSVFQLDDTSAQEISTPLSKIQTMPEKQTIRRALAILPQQKYSRIPVLSADRRHILGIIYTKDLVRAKMEDRSEALDASITTLMRKPMVVAPSIKLNALFRKFKQQRTHMAVLQDSSGHALGIVTMNDVLEELFEEMLPEDLA